MADDDLTLENVRKMAADIGMTHFDHEHLQQLLRATRTARARRATLSFTNLTPADEPAHMFNLDAREQS